VIHFSLICEHEHEFDSWFANNNAYDEQKQAGLVTCPFCGSQKIQKQLMAPSISTKTNRTGDPGNQHQAMLSARHDPVISEITENIRKMRQHVSENAEDVGKNFAKEAREIHYEEKPARNIYGQATFDDARLLLEEGVNVMALPALPEDKN